MGKIALEKRRGRRENFQIPLNVSPLPLSKHYEFNCTRRPFQLFIQSPFPSRNISLFSIREARAARCFGTGVVCLSIEARRRNFQFRSFYTRLAYAWFVKDYREKGRKEGRKEHEWIERFRFRGIVCLSPRIIILLSLIMIVASRRRVFLFFFFYRPYGEAPRATSRLIVSVFSLFIPPFRFERTELCRISRARILLAEVLSFFYSLISFSKEKRIELRREETRVKKRAKWRLLSWILN